MAVYNAYRLKPQSLTAKPGIVWGSGPWAWAGIWGPSVSPRAAGKADEQMLSSTL